MERFEIASSRTSIGFGETTGSLRTRGMARALTLFTYSAIGWAVLVGCLFLVASAL